VGKSVLVHSRKEKGPGGKQDFTTSGEKAFGNKNARWVSGTTVGELSRLKHTSTCGGNEGETGVGGGVIVAKGGRGGTRGG